MALEAVEDDDNDFYRRDPTRHRYLAREILKYPPLEMAGRQLPVKVDKFYRRGGEMNEDGEVLRPISQVLRPSCIAIALPVGFDAQYGEGLDGPDIADMVAGALRHHLRVPLSQFVAGHAFDGTDLKAHLVVMDKGAYLNMAKAALVKLADSTKGAELIGLKNADLYRNALRNADSDASQIVKNLFGHATLGREDIETLQRMATQSDNFEFMAYLKAPRKTQGGTPSL